MVTPASIARCARNPKFESTGAVGAHGGSKVDLLERNLFVMSGVEIGERLCREHVVLHLFRRAAAFEDYRERPFKWGRDCGALSGD